AGLPKFSGKPLGSYEQWSAVTGGILEFHGIEGFLGNLDEFYEAADEESDQLRAFVQAWAATYGDRVLTSMYLVSAAQSAGIDLGPSKDTQAKAIRVGLYLKAHSDRIIDGYKIVKDGNANNSSQWRLQKVKVNGS